MLADIFSTFLWTLLVWLSAQVTERTLRLVLFNHVRKLSLIRSHFVHSEENLLDILLISWFKIKEICVRKECGMSSLDLKCDNTKAILRNGLNNFDSGCCLLLFYHSFQDQSTFQGKIFVLSTQVQRWKSLLSLGSPPEPLVQLLKKPLTSYFFWKSFRFTDLVFVNPWNHHLNRLASDFWNVVISRNLFLSILVLTYAWCL